MHKYARYPWNDAVRLNWLTVCFIFINWGIGLGGEWQSASCKFPLLHNRTQCWDCSCTGPKARCSVSAEQVPKNCAHLCWICGHCRSCERCEPRGGMCCLGLKLLTELCILILLVWRSYPPLSVQLLIFVEELFQMKIWTRLAACNCTDKSCH